MRRVELLSPVGNMDMLYAAIHAGCDAVYLSGKNFGARKFAQNFNDNEIIEAINISHLYGIKIYVTVNTLIYDNEVDEFIKYIEFLYRNGIDAVIMQDIGMIDLVRKKYPNLEIHSSTQVHTKDIDTVKVLKDMGINRVVLARECDLNTIKEASKLIDIEIFIHGALCISYSGQCLMSSLNSNRSGNRGECAQYCRMRYKLIDEHNNEIKTKGEYLLSPKDLCSIYNIKEIIESGVSSLKIEGRMKSREYVYLVTSLYRKAIDLYYEGKEIIIDEELLNDIKREFNRGFTTGYLIDYKNDTLINQKRPNHKGIEIGSTIKITDKKITIRLSSELNQGDGIKFENVDKGFIVNKLYKGGVLVNKGNKNDIVELDNVIDLKTKDVILKTYDVELINRLKSIKEKKIGIDIEIYASVNEKLKLVFKDNENKVEAYGNIVSTAKTSPISKDQIIKQVTKLGDTVFEANNIKTHIDNNIFISIKELNELRRDLVDKLIKLRTKSNKEIIIQEYKEKPHKNYNKDTFKINVLVRNEEQLKTVLDLNIDNIYVTDYDLYSKYKQDNLYYVMPRIYTDIKDIENVVINDLESTNNYKNVISNYNLNITNSYSLLSMHNRNVNTVCLSAELNLRNIDNLLNAYRNRYNSNPNIEIMIYGYYEAMILKYDLLLDNGIKDFKDYYLEDIKGSRFKVIRNQNYTSIFNSKLCNKIEELDKIRSIGINNARLEFMDETKEEIKSILNICFNKLKGEN